MNVHVEIDEDIDSNLVTPAWMVRVPKALRDEIASARLLARLMREHREQLGIKYQAVDLDQPPLPARAAPPLMRVTKTNHGVGNIVPIPTPAGIEEPAAIKYPTAHLVTATVAKFYGLTVRQLQSQGRTQYPVRARQIAIFLASELTLASVSDICRRMGGRDHTTGLHSIKIVKKKMAVDERMKDEIDVLRLRIATAMLNEGAAQ